MNRLITLLATLICAFGPAQAQEPVVELSLAEESVAVGQPVILRLTVLVPSFMPNPPSLPSFETPNLLVRLNGRATSPTSKSVDGETWSGVTRSYTLYPMVAGPFEIPAQQVSITYRGTGTEDITTTVATEPFTLTGLVPEGAEGLDPLVIAKGLTVTQEIVLPEGDIAVGDAVTRSLSAKITGTAPLFVPPLLRLPDESELRAYPKDAVLTESMDRGVLSGTRQEEASYIALSEGPAELPEITLEWYNPSSNSVETITLEGASFEVLAGPAAPIAWDRGLILRLVLAAAGLIAVGFGYLRFGHARVLHWWAARHAARALSARQMWADIERAIAAQDLAQTLARLSAFEARHGALDPSPDFESAMAQVTAIIYGSGAVSDRDAKARWAALARAFDARHPAGRGTRKAEALPALNPL
ncbi:BatD family protein [Dinoroseobacter sp. S124A]|uniref:BatD family protein n=1 Tax=Dinoroseobacter sp. S124A TaxID=3415128 RepID=UPI003C7A9DDD